MPGQTLADVRRLALALPEVVEGTSYGTVAFKVAGKLFARAHQDGASLVLRCDLDDRDQLLRARPAQFFITDHYTAYPWVLASLAKLSRAALATALADAWQCVAPARLAATLASCSRGHRYASARRCPV